MSEQLYSIKESTLTGIGDALRRRHGETEWVVNNDEGAISFITKSPNTTGHGEYGGQFGTEWTVDVYHIPGAKKIKAKVSSAFYTGNQKIIIVEGVVKSYTDVQFNNSVSYNNTVELEFNTDTISVAYEDGFKQEGNLGYYAEFWAYDSEGNVLQQVRNTYTSDEMARAIDDIEVNEPPPEEAFVLSGNCSNMFELGRWHWYLEMYGNKITTKDITSTRSMFSQAKVTEIPFEINFKDGGGDCSFMFNLTSNLNKIPSIDFKQTSTYRDCQEMYATAGAKEIGKIKNLYPSDISSMFYNCCYLRSIPEFENLNLSRIQTYKYGSCDTMFSRCYSLRSIPEEFLKQFYGIWDSYYSSFANYAFHCCYTLDEIKGFNPQTGVMTSNIFTETFTKCYRLKNIIFATQEDGTPYSVSWKNQTLTLTKGIGFAQGDPSARELITTRYNSGITADKEVVDDESYARLKNDPDWFTIKKEYSRYNKESAIATINSLPDTSAYLASAGGTNTLQFYGEAGAATDGGAISGIDESVVAIAAAKGWTIAYF